jgi:hypothetical protein
MTLRLANENDCQFFKFWLQNQICPGINCQGEIFLQVYVFPAKQRDQAYELGAQLAEKTAAVVIVCAKNRYVLGVDLRGESWKTFDPVQLGLQEPDLLRKLRITLGTQRPSYPSISAFA